MPIITVHMLEGRSKEKKKELIQKITGTVTETLQMPPESVRVVLEEMSHDNYGVAGLPIMEYRLKKAEENKK